MASDRRDVRVVADPTALFREAAEELTARAEQAARERGVFTVALAGGRTPRGLYELLAGEGDLTFRKRVPWDRTQFFWSDERLVPADHPDSNYGMARAAMLSKLTLRSKQVHRVRTEGLDAVRAAHEYERELRSFFAQQGLRPGGIPRFDLVLLGMGVDGHAASLFPGTSAFAERHLLVAGTRVGKPPVERVTFTLPLLNQAACVLFLVSGDDKAETVQAVLEGPRRPNELPAQLVRPGQGDLIWIVDRAAGRLLPAASS